MMNKHLLTALLCILFSLAATAQESTTLQKYDQLTIQYNGDNSFYIGSEKYKRRQIETLLASSRAAAAEYELYRKNSLKAGFLGLGAIGMLIGGLTQLEKNRTLSWVLLGASGVTNFISLPLQLRSKRHFQKSVWLYNRDVIQ